MYWSSHAYVEIRADSQQRLVFNLDPDCSKHSNLVDKIQNDHFQSGNTNI